MAAEVDGRLVEVEEEMVAVEAEVGVEEAEVLEVGEEAGARVAAAADEMEVVVEAVEGAVEL